MLRFKFFWILVCTVCVFFVSSEEIAAENENTNAESVKDDHQSPAKARNDLPDLSDEVLRNFFDFVDDNDDDPQKKKSSSKPGSKYKYPVKKPLHHSHYGHPNVPSLVTPGTHYREDIHKPPPQGSVTPDGKSMVVGNYQVSVVDATSPLLSSLGLKRHHLEQLAGAPMPNRKSTPDLTSSESSHATSYAEYPRNYQAAPSYSSYQRAPSSYGPHHSHDHPHPNEPYQPSPSRDHTSPQRSGYSHDSGPQSQRYGSSHSYHSESYQTSRHPPDSWKPSPSNEYGPKIHYDDNYSHRQNPNYNRGLYKQSDQLYPPHPPPLPYKNPPETQDLNPSYKPYAKPAIGAVSPSYHNKQDSTYSNPSYTSSDRYSSGYSSYSSGRPGASSSSKTPARAGSVAHESYHAPHPPKPSISISFKAKAPGHGVSIPINFNPLDVVKKIALPLSALNPLANKKVTIGITIENKEKQHAYETAPHY